MIHIAIAAVVTYGVVDPNHSGLLGPPVGVYREHGQAVRVAGILAEQVGAVLVDETLHGAAPGAWESEAGARASMGCALVGCISGPGRWTQVSPRAKSLVSLARTPPFIQTTTGAEEAWEGSSFSCM